MKERAAERRPALSCSSHPPTSRLEPFAVLTSTTGMRRVVFILLVLVSCTSSGTPEETPAAIRNDRFRTSSQCAATTPNGNIPPNEYSTTANHGNGELWVLLEPGGQVQVREIDVNPDGSMTVKFPWFRGVRGELQITGHRLDANAAPLRSTVPKGYPGKGFQASGIIFPTPGCWEITGRVGDASLTFVVEIIEPPSA
jgi:hypothetical protein